jgi:trans-2,3-dihydro-3-hydroxyanthranilate isomerase
MARRYHTLDVFTDTRLAGNPLAVVLDADGLDAAAMQKIAREFNLSETVFVLPAEDAKHRARLRIFTPGKELPFAGHPTVGTAVLIATLDHGGAEGAYLFGLEETIGTMSCAVTIDPAKASHARFGLPQLPVETGATADTDVIARALGLDPADIGFENHHPTRFSAGVPYTLVPLRDLRAMSRIALDTALWTRAFGQKGLGAAFVYTRQALDERSDFHARMFSLGDGIREDPATGSAVAALAGAIARFDDLAPGDRLLRVEQGYEMGRPSTIELGLTIEGVALASATIGGGAVLVGEGMLRV